jgi:beta-glucosidase
VRGLIFVTGHDERIAGLLDALTVAEKAELVTGDGIWTTRPVERLGIPAMTVTDGPNGARGGGLMGTGTPTACIPAGSVLGATWDPDLLEELGALLGDESAVKGANVLLAPTINLHRNPLGGRNFECYSEDPVLTGLLAAGFIRGVQSRNVAVTAKHFVANDSEFERNTIDSQVDERTLREVYMLPFEYAVKEGGAWGIMSSYNRVNGMFASEHDWLLGTVLRDQWGFDGFVVSDWFAVRSTGPSITAGLSLEMPGRGQWYGPKRIMEALDSGACDEADLDRIVIDMLTVLDRTGAFDGVGGGEEGQLDRVEDRALIRRASAEGMVLIKNDGFLPLDTSSLGSLAVIGPNAQAAKIMGGGSAAVRPYRNISPLAALTDRFNIEVRHAHGCNIDRSTPPVGIPFISSLETDFFNGFEQSGAATASKSYETADFKFFGSPADGIDSGEYSFTATTSLTVDFTGPYELTLVQNGRTKVLIDGMVVIDATEGDFGRGDDFFGLGSGEITGTIDLTAGQSAEMKILYSSEGGVMILGCKVGLRSLGERDLISEAEIVAASADAAVVVVGTNDDWETEGRDRDSFALPGQQEELIRRVCAANPNTVVVVNVGGPHDMGWMDAPRAVLNIGFAGQELGDALVDVLVGDVDPGGRMPTTIPARYEHSPAYLNYPGENSAVRYGEGLYVGYRWFDARHIDPAVPFGHGLSYATFAWENARVSGSGSTAFSDPVVIEVDVTNTSGRTGSDVVQVYVEPPPSLLHRPVRELKGFAKIRLKAGETGTVRIELNERSFAYFDPGDQFYDSIPDTSPVPRERGERHSQPGWYVTPGSYGLVVARSSVDHVEELPYLLDGNEFRIDP